MNWKIFVAFFDCMIASAIPESTLLDLDYFKSIEAFSNFAKWIAKQNWKFFSGWFNLSKRVLVENAATTIPFLIGFIEFTSFFWEALGWEYMAAENLNMELAPEMFFSHFKSCWNLLTG